MNPEERARRGTDEYLAGRRANGFGTQKRGSEHPNAKVASQLRKLLSEHLDDKLAGATDGTTDELRARLVAEGLTRIDAAMRVLDDALCERTKSGKCTDNAMQAAKFIINHRFGRPKQAIEVAATSDDQLFGQIDKRTQQAAATMGEQVIKATRTRE